VDWSSGDTGALDKLIPLVRPNCIGWRTII
jgi:hypothetical protein